MSPSEFWRLHPQEFWWLLEANRRPKMYGKLTEAETAELYRDAFGDDRSRPKRPLDGKARTHAAS